MSSSSDDWRASRDYKRRQRDRIRAQALAIRCPACKAPPHSDCNDQGGVCLERSVAAADKGGQPMIKPADVAVSDIVVLTDALGKTEIEAAAALVVLWHRAHGHDEWVPVSRRTIIEWLEESVKVRADVVLTPMVRNPFWRPDPDGLRVGGWITGWTTPDEAGVFTEKALRCIETRGLWQELR